MIHFDFEQKQTSHNHDSIFPLYDLNYLLIVEVAMKSQFQVGTVTVWHD